MKKLIHYYIGTFAGLSKEVWWLALVTFINRSGTMVIPFLSLYLTDDLGFSLDKQVAWIMSAFGLGSVIGSWIGGKLADRVGFYKVMVVSLMATGFLFIGLQYLKTFESLCLGIFITTLIADTFRPAMFVAMSAYSKPENKARSVTLIRLAINLGFSAGPAIGGLIIAHLSYAGLFWVDGITCILATLLFIKVLNPRVAKTLDNHSVENPRSVYKDKPFWIFFAGMILFGMAFLQYFSTIPLYYRDVHLLSEPTIGLLMGMNGFLIFLLEMPVIKWLENSKYSKVGLILFGALLTALSFIVLDVTSWAGVLIIGMLFMTIGEMVAFPFANAFAVERARHGRQGEYMAYFTITFSFGHIFGHNLGMQFVSLLGFDATWYIMAGIMLISAGLFWLLKRRVKLE
ncbi:MAG: MFS transporter [Flavobacteriaceae bacterium]|nr:MFS transporter [Mangrovimonas sp.]HRV56045.1 MFS transporter [Mangrovimonas sp.]